MDTLGVINLEGFGIDKNNPAFGMCWPLLLYVSENLRSKPDNLSSIKEYSSDSTLLLDPVTTRNLEIFRSTRGTRAGSLLQAISRVKTASGARLLEQWLIAPERSLDELQRRQDCIERFAASPIASSEIQDLLKSARDIKRILGRIQNRIRNPRELGGIRETLNQLPAIIDALGNVKSAMVDSITRSIDPLPHLADLLNRALKEEMPNSLSDGGYIALGYDAALDEMLSLTTDNKLWLSNLEADERERTGIKNLKVKFNNVFGYFIEVTKANLNLVPDNYIRKQTMVNGERFVTESLKKKEKEIFHADENSKGEKRNSSPDL